MGFALLGEVPSVPTAYASHSPPPHPLSGGEEGCVCTGSLMSSTVVVQYRLTHVPEGRCNMPVCVTEEEQSISAVSNIRTKGRKLPLSRLRGTSIQGSTEG